MKNIRVLLAAAAILITGVISCSKGDTGPAGPAGPAGPDSVTYSGWINLQATYNANDTAYEDTLLAPSITKAILDSGVVLSYVNFLDNGTYHVVPTSGLVPYLLEDFSVGKINLVSGYFDFSNTPYRYVTIPGSLKTGTNTANQKIKGYTIQELKAMPFEQVQQVLADKN